MKCKAGMRWNRGLARGTSGIDRRIQCKRILGMAFALHALQHEHRWRGNETCSCLTLYRTWCAQKNVTSRC